MRRQVERQIQVIGPCRRYRQRAPQQADRNAADNAILFGAANEDVGRHLAKDLVGPARERLEAEIAAKQETIAAPDFYTQDAGLVQQKLRELSAAEEELERLRSGSD